MSESNPTVTASSVDTAAVTPSTSTTCTDSDNYTTTTASSAANMSTVVPVAHTVVAESPLTSPQPISVMPAAAPTAAVSGLSLPPAQEANHPSAVGAPAAAGSDVVGAPAQHVVDVNTTNQTDSQTPSIPTHVSEQEQEAARKAEEEKNNTGFFKQNLAKVKRGLCGPLHIGDAAWVAWNIFWFIIAGTTTNGFKWFALFLALLFYVWYVHWNWKSDERLFLSRMMSLQEFAQYWKEVTAAGPVIKMETVCWHWERRTHTTTTYNANGGTTTTTSVTYVKRVTFEEVEIFTWTLCVDSSGMFESLDLAKVKPVTYVTLWKEYAFLDAYTATAYINQAAALKQRNQNKDKEMTFSEWMEIPGFHRCTTVYRDNPPFLLKVPIFMLCAVLMLSWPMKLYFEYIGKRGGFTLKKSVQK